MKRLLSCFALLATLLGFFSVDAHAELQLQVSGGAVTWGGNSEWKFDSSKPTMDKQADGTYSKVVKLKSGQYFSIYTNEEYTDNNEKKYKQYNNTDNNTNAEISTLPISNYDMSQNDKGMKWAYGSENTETEVKVTVGVSGNAPNKLAIEKYTPVATEGSKSVEIKASGLNNWGDKYKLVWDSSAKAYKYTFNDKGATIGNFAFTIDSNDYNTGSIDIENGKTYQLAQNGSGKDGQLKDAPSDKPVTFSVTEDLKLTVTWEATPVQPTELKVQISGTAVEEGGGSEFKFDDSKTCLVKQADGSYKGQVKLKKGDNIGFAVFTDENNGKRYCFKYSNNDSEYIVKDDSKVDNVTLGSGNQWFKYTASAATYTVTISIKDGVPSAISMTKVETPVEPTELKVQVVGDDIKSGGNAVSGEWSYKSDGVHLTKISDTTYSGVVEIKKDSWFGVYSNENGGKQYGFKDKENGSDSHRKVSSLPWSKNFDSSETQGLQLQVGSDYVSLKVTVTVSDGSPVSLKLEEVGADGDPLPKLAEGKTRVYFVGKDPHIYSFDNPKSSNGWKQSYAQGGWDGAPAMTKITNTGITEGIEMESGESLFYYDVDMAKFPEVIFKDDSKQTRNLWVVPDGVYRLGSSLYPKGQLIREVDVDKQFVGYTLEYLASNYADKHATTIYLKDDAFFKDDADYDPSTGTSHGGQRVCVAITVKDNDGNEKTVTGDLGTNEMIDMVYADDIKLLYITLPNEVCPPGQIVKIHFNAYATDGKVLSWDGTHVEAKNLSNDGTTVTEYKDAEGNVIYKYRDKTGATEELRPIEFTEVLYDEGMVYSRPEAPLQNINDLIQLEKLYIVGTNLTEGNATEQEIEMTLKPDGTYTLTNVPEAAVFHFKGVMSNTSKDYNFSAGEAVSMMTGNPYDIKADDTETPFNYSIKAGQVATGKYNVVVDWLAQEVVLQAVKANAEFRFENGYDVIPAKGNNCKDCEPVIVSHSAVFGGRGGTIESHYKACEITIAPQKAYAASVDKEINHPAEITKFQPVEATDDKSEVRILAHTAGIYDLTIKQNLVIEDLHRTEVTMPVRVVPTVESVGLAINWTPITWDATNETYMMPFGTENQGDITDPNGYTWNTKKVHISALEADNDEVEVWFKLEPKNAAVAAQKTPSFYTVLRRESAVTDVYSETQPDPATNGYQKFGATSTTNVTTFGEDDLKDNDLYIQVKHNGILSAPVLAAKAGNVVTAVEEVEAVEAEAEYYDLNGFRVDAANLKPGIYVKRTGATAAKVLVK